MTGLWCANPRMAAEQFDEEVVLIDIEKGIYFSLTGAAVGLWGLLQSPRRIESVTAAFPAEHVADVVEAIEGLRHHELIVVAPVTATEAAPLTEILKFTPAGIQAFSDLAELITIDPVHEVDAQLGWPQRPSNFPDSQ